MKKIKLNPVPKDPPFSVGQCERVEMDGLVAVTLINPCRGGFGKGKYNIYFSKYDAFDPSYRIGKHRLDEMFSPDELDQIRAEYLLAVLK